LASCPPGTAFGGISPLRAKTQAAPVSL